VLRWIGRCERQIVVDPSACWADPTRTATLVLPDLPAAAGRPAPEESAWLHRWRRAGRAAAAVLDEMVCTDPLSEPGVARTLGEALESGALLFAGPSRPIRDLDLCLPARADLRVLANRGVNGIDGVVSAAVGAALVHRREHGGRTVALLGDLTYLYDRNGLLLGVGEERPDLTLVVVDNDGGGIFSTLPQAGADHFERVFGTPHGIDLCVDAATAGIPATTVTTAAELAEAIQEPCGFRMVRVPTERADTAKLHRGLQEAIGAALRP
jgi:2-succinyl-5-enolpyruvyl-6-hydroxy-3-cyclohexene-1-carboxylate synthase